MGTSENNENVALGGTALLAEILGVLKRIDGHLESQQSRIGLLDAKVTALAAKTKLTQIQIPSSHAEIRSTADITASPGTTSKGSFPPANPLQRPQNVKLQKLSRNDSVESLDPREAASGARIEARGEAGSNSGSSQSRKQIESERNISLGSVKEGAASNPETKSLTQTGTRDSNPQQATTEEIGLAKTGGDAMYSEFPPPDSWITTRYPGRVLDVKYNSEEAKALWTTYVGDSWTIPPDGRIEMTFQQHLLERLDKDKVTRLLKSLHGVSNRLEYRHPSDRTKRGSFRVTDFGFDPNFEESVAEYRSEVLTGKYKLRPVPNRLKNVEVASLQTAFWKRMIEIRGLSKELIDEHETWTRNFRDPWTEALPVISPVCPFFTDREGDLHNKTFTGMNAVNQALLHHQQCRRRQPPGHVSLCFHITFYEIIDLAHDDEVEGDIWRSGRLHSDNEKELESLFGVKSRRIRESACTIVFVVEPDLQYWTSIYLCPNNFDLYDKSPKSINMQNAHHVIADMIEFTMRMVVERWTKIATYFAWLIGHRDTLPDPDAHDSLLFDDDSFSRSRRYFWAINYLAELDDSISENIVQLGLRVPLLSPYMLTNLENDEGRTDVKPLEERLDQLKGVRARLRAQREEAIALRDGLFSASGVIESRASTRLGENVKLLTFVSIFFLPLSFCMSVWSVNNTIFSLKALLIVSILVGLSTYLIVFNLNNMVNFSSRIYNEYKKSLIAQMKEDRDGGWNERGKRFARLKPKQENIKPSEWVIGLFIMHKSIRWLNIGRGHKREKEPVQMEEDRGSGSVREWSGFPAAADAELANAGDPPKIRKMKIKEKVEVKSGFARLSKVFRRGALSPGFGPDV